MPVTNVVYTSELTVTESVSGSAPDLASGRDSVVHSGFDSSDNATPTTSPPVSLNANFTQALSSGAGTVDLTNLPGTTGAVNGTGLKVRFIKIQNTSTNPMTFVQGASNGYGLLGSSWSITLAGGQEILLSLQAGCPTIGSGAKKIDITGTGSNSFNIVVVLG
jgi:hypothetical protein